MHIAWARAKQQSLGRVQLTGKIHVSILRIESRQICYEATTAIDGVDSWGVS
jgi:hypothetical protein